MTDDSKLVEQMARANRAAQLLNDEMFAEAIEGLKAEFIRKWLDTKSSDDRERIWMAVHLIENIKGALVTTVAHGRVAHQQLEEMASGRSPTHLQVV